MVEEFVDEHFMKYINNDGRILKAGDSDIDISKKADCYCYIKYQIILYYIKLYQIILYQIILYPISNLKVNWWF